MNAEILNAHRQMNRRWIFRKLFIRWFRFGIFYGATGGFAVGAIGIFVIGPAGLLMGPVVGFMWGAILGLMYGTYTGIFSGTGIIPIDSLESYKRKMQRICTRSGFAITLVVFSLYLVSNKAAPPELSILAYGLAIIASIAAALYIRLAASQIADWYFGKPPSIRW